LLEAGLLEDEHAARGPTINAAGTTRYEMAFIDRFLVSESYDVGIDAEKDFASITPTPNNGDKLLLRLDGQSARLPWTPHGPDAIRGYRSRPGHRNGRGAVRRDVTDAAIRSAQQDQGGATFIPSVTGPGKNMHLDPSSRVA
jgi:hypothetical protein